jgi:hypothetical protein
MEIVRKSSQTQNPVIPFSPQGTRLYQLAEATRREASRMLSRNDSLIAAPRGKKQAVATCANPPPASFFIKLILMYNIL